MPVAPLRGVNLHYAQIPARSAPGDGHGEVILVHGLGANVAFWFFGIAPHLAESHRVTMFDLRGHGRSSMPMRGYSPQRMADDLSDLLDYLQIKDAVHLVAHSYGALVALKFACHHPARTRSLTIVDVRLKALQPHLMLAAWRHWPRYRRLVEHLGLRIDARTNFFGFQLLEEIARQRGSRHWDREALAELVPPAFADGGRRGAARRWLELLERTSARWELLSGDDLTWDSLRRLRKPTLALYGEHSPLAPTGQALKTLWPHAQVAMIAGSGHFFPTSRPAALFEPVKKFLADGALAEQLPAPLYD